MRNKKFPNYPDDTDYTTNSNSYYDDLARKQKLIQLLAEKIWEYDERLDERLEDLENVLQDYLAQWDNRIENLDDEVSDIFVTWLNDGTLEQIINHDVLGNKADKSFVDDELEKVNTQLEQMPVNVKNFGAIGNNNADDTLAIQAAIDSVGTYGSVYLPKGRYRVTSPINFPENSAGIKLYSDANARLTVDHNGTAINLIGQNSNYGYNVIEGIQIYGPNSMYPTELYNPPSTGAGIYMKEAYYNVIRDCYIIGFKYGVHIQGQSIKNRFEGKTYIRFNQTGVFINGGAVNSNNFVGVSIRENRQRGVHIKGGVAGFATQPTRNHFDSCLIESNNPYPTRPNDHTLYGVGVYIELGIHNIFSGCYSENHDVAILLGSQAQGNIFDNYRFNQGEAYKNLDRILFDGTSIANNTFTSLFYNTYWGRLNVEMVSGSTLADNNFIDCVGLNFGDDAYNNVGISLINCRPTPAELYSSDIDRMGLLTGTQGSTTENIVKGTGRGQIDGVGTENATLNIRGYNVMTFNNQITAPTTISNIVGGKRGQIVILTNYQPNHRITIKHHNTNLKLQYNRDVVLKDINDTIVFYVNTSGRINEIGRNFKTGLHVSINVPIGTIEAYTGVTIEVDVPGLQSYRGVTVNSLGGVTTGLIFQGFCTANDKLSVSIYNASPNPIGINGNRGLTVSQL